MIQTILLVVGFVFLIKGAGFLVDGASSIARRLKVSDLVIGLTVVAFGTSMPELSVNIIASIKGDAGIVIGNILGSNIANVLLILGISSIIYPLTVTKGTVWKEIPLSLLAALILGVLANDEFTHKRGLSALTRIDGLILIIFFIIFLYYILSIAKRVERMDEQRSSKEYGLSSSYLLVILGLIGLSVGSKWVVDGAVYIASTIGVSQSFIGLTVVALGTSLPELATSATAAYRKNPEIAVGNVVGSNIFNIFWILGLSSLIKPIPFQTRYNIDVGVVIFSSALLFVTMFTGRKRLLDRWEGIIFVILYVSYIAFLIILS